MIKFMIEILKKKIKLALLKRENNTWTATPSSPPSFVKDKLFPNCKSKDNEELDKFFKKNE